MNILIHILTLGMLYFPSYYDIVHLSYNSVQLEHYLWHFEYVPDSHISQEFKDPDTFYADRAGDCEDFAVFVYEILTPKGYNCKIYKLYNSEISPSTAHCIVTYVKGTDRGYFSNWVRHKHVTDPSQICEDLGYQTYRQLDWRIHKQWINR